MLSINRRSGNAGQSTLLGMDFSGAVLNGYILVNKRDEKKKMKEKKGEKRKE